MECEHKNLSQQQFDEKTKRFKNRKELYFFILNTLSLIIYNGHYYCFCEKFMKKRLNEKNCAICQIPLTFCNFEKDLNKNMFNEVFFVGLPQKTYVSSTKNF